MFESLSGSGKKLPHSLQFPKYLPIRIVLPSFNFLVFSGVREKKFSGRNAVDIFVCQQICWDFRLSLFKEPCLVCSQLVVVTDYSFCSLPLRYDVCWTTWWFARCVTPAEYLVPGSKIYRTYHRSNFLHPQDALFARRG